MIKLNKNIIMYITEDLEEPFAYILNCETNAILKIDSIGVEYIKKILNAKSTNDVAEYLSFFEGCDLFEK